MPHPLSEKTKITPKQRKFFKYLTEGCGVGEAALRAGYTDPHYGSYLKAQEKIQTALQKSMEKAGLTNPYIAKGLKEGTKATFPERRSKDGDILQAEHPDNQSRKGFYDLILKIGGHFAPEEKIERKESITFNITTDKIDGFLEAGVISEGEHEVIMGELEHEPVRKKEEK